MSKEVIIDDVLHVSETGVVSNLLTPTQVCKYLRISARTLAKLVKLKTLIPFRFNKRGDRLFSLEEIKTFAYGKN